MAVPKHRDLNLRKFVAQIPPDLMARYLTSLAGDRTPGDWATLNGDALLYWLEEPENDALKGLVDYDFKRVNDIATFGEGPLLEAYRYYRLPLDQNATNEALSLELYLSYPEAWGKVWSRFLMSSLSGKASHYRLPAKAIELSSELCRAFESDVRKGHAARAMGNLAKVHPYDDAGQVLLYVERGQRMRATAHWEGADVSFMAYRPAVEDVLTYSGATGEVKVKATLASDIADYVRLFSRHFLSDDAAGLAAMLQPTFDLEPFQTGTFDYRGGKHFAQVALVGAKFRPRGQARATVLVSSADVLMTLRMMNISLLSTELLAVRLSFKLPKKALLPSVTFEIAPPVKTDLPDNRYADLINEYLAQNGVRLR